MSNKFVEMRWLIPKEINAAAPRLQYRSLDALSPSAWNNWGEWQDVQIVIDDSIVPVADENQHVHEWEEIEEGLKRICECGERQRKGEYMGAIRWIGMEKMQRCDAEGKAHTWFYTEHGTRRDCLCGAKQRQIYAKSNCWEDYE